MELAGSLESSKEAKNGEILSLSEINKIGIGFISIFLLKARVSYLTILKRKNLSLSLKDKTDQFVICLVLPECLAVKIAFYPRTVRRIVTALMLRFLSHCFSLFLPHLRTLAHEKRSENCRRFATSGPSLCLYPLLWRNIILFPALTRAAGTKKILAKPFAYASSEHYRDFEHAYVY